MPSSALEEAEQAILPGPEDAEGQSSREVEIPLARSRRISRRSVHAVALGCLGLAAVLAVAALRMQGGPASTSSVRGQSLGLDESKGKDKSESSSKESSDDDDDESKDSSNDDALKDSDEVSKGPKVKVKKGDHIHVDKEDRDKHKKDRLKAQAKKKKAEKKEGYDMSLGWYNHSHRWPSLFCFAQMMPYQAEEQLILSQFKARKGIFACNNFAVLSTQNRTLGKGHDGNLVYTWVNPTPAVPMGGGPGTQTKSFLNTQAFINAWNILIKSKVLWKHDWAVKVDPDAVFFPDRLKDHLWKHTQTKKKKMYYTLNCAYQGQPTLYGALEVFSRYALYNYEANKYKCDALDWRGKWGEDMYMHMCMIQIGVSPLVDYQLVGDNRCMQAACSDKWRAAFHDYKDPGSWWNCYCQSAPCQNGNGR